MAGFCGDLYKNGEFYKIDDYSTMFPPNDHHSRKSFYSLKVNSTIRKTSIQHKYLPVWKETDTTFRAIIGYVLYEYANNAYYGIDRYRSI